VIDVKFKLGISVITLAFVLMACNTSFGDSALSNLSGSGNGSTIGSDGTISGEIRIALAPSSAFVGVKGKAKFKNRGGERELEVEVENLAGRSGQSVSVCLNNLRVGGAVINPFNEANMNLNSDRGQTVPNVTKGSSVQVWLSASCSGNLVASGLF
jgi:hypothetical protein